MANPIPQTAQEFAQLSWPEIEPFYNELQKTALNDRTVNAWLADWTRLGALVSETQQRLYVASSIDTSDQQAARNLFHFLEDVFPPVEATEQQLRRRLLSSRLAPAGFEVPLRNMNTQVALFRQANLALLTEEHRLENEYDRTIAAQTVVWEGCEQTITQLRPVHQNTDRTLREKAWRMVIGRQLADRAALNDLWRRYLKLRQRMAVNVGYPDYRAYRWQQMLRFDYTPADCARFHEAIEQVVVPAAERLYERRRRQLGLDSLRPWDLEVDPTGQEALHPFNTLTAFEEGAQTIFQRVDATLCDDFARMRREKLLDLGNHKGKAPGGFCTQFAVIKRPFIFMNAVGVHEGRANATA